MYRRQRGIQPFVSSLMVVFWLLMWTFGFVFAWQENIAEGSTFLANIFEYFLIVFSLLFGILMYSSRYPRLKFSNEGIHYKYFLFFGGLIRWNEVSEFREIDMPKSMRGIYALVIDREGYSFPFHLKGFYFQQFHSMRIGTFFTPTLLITPQSIS